MSRFMEDLLCGIVGYGFGKYNRQIVKNGGYPFSENGDIRSLLSVQN